MNQSSESERQPTDAERVRWALLGFGSADDLSDMTEERIRAAKEELSANASAFTKSGLKQPVTMNGGLVKTLALTACTVLVFYGLFVSIHKAVADQQVLAGNHYAQQLMEFSLDLFEEDLGVISDQAARSDVLLPEPMFWSVDRYTQKRMHACPQAIEALRSVRMGFPEVGCYQLENIPLLLNADSQWLGESESKLEFNQRDLEFVYHLTSGKALCESLQTATARAYLLTDNRRDFSHLAETAFRSLQHALDMIQDQQLAKLSIRDEEVLKSAIQIDLARARLKFGAIAANDRSLSRLQQKEAVRLDLELVKQRLKNFGVRDVRCLIQSARCLNNQILAMEQIQRLSPPVIGDEMRQLIDDVSAEITELFQEVETLEGASAVPAMNFELAICYSNLADLTRSAWEFGRLNERDAFVSERIALREKAATLLSKVPRLNRTERHFENVVTNKARRLQTEFFDGFLADSEFTPSNKLRSDALELSKLVGQVLQEGEVGQVPSESRVVIALLLPDRYPIEDVAKFANRLPDVEGWRARSLLKKLISEKLKANVQP